MGEAAAAVAAVLLLLTGLVIVRSETPINAALRLTDGSVWLPSTGLGVVTLHDSGDGAAITDVTISAPGEDVVVEQAGADAVVVNRSTGGVSVVDGADWTVGRTIALGSPDDPHLGVEVDLDGAWLVQSASITPLELPSLQPGSAFPRGEDVHDAAIGADGRLIVSSALDDGSLAVYDAEDATSERVDDVQGPAEVFRVGDEVVAIEPRTSAVWVAGRGIVCDGLEVPADADLVAEGGNDVAVVVSDAGSAFIWDPTDGCPPDDSFTSLGVGDYGRPVLTDGWGVIPDYANAVVYLINVPDRRIEVDRPIPLPGITPESEFDLVAENGAVWFNDPSTAAAGLIAPDGSVTEIEKWQLGADGRIATADEDGDADRRSAGGDDGGQDDAEPDATTTTTSPAADQAVEVEGTTSTTSGDRTTTTAPASLATTTTVGVAGPTTVPVETSTTDGGTPPTTDDPTTSQPSTTGVAPSTSDLPPTTAVEGQLAVQIAVSQNPTAGEPVTLLANVTEGTADRFAWTLSPDPNTRTDRQELSVVLGEGRVTAQVEACNDTQCARDIVAFDVTAEATVQPSASIDPSRTTLEVGQAATFRDASTGADHRSWSFEEGTPASSAAANPSVSWDTTGTYLVTLEVWNGDGATDTAEILVTVTDSVDVPDDLQLSCSPGRLVLGETATCSVPGSVRSAVDSLTFTSRGAAADLQPSNGSVRVEPTATGTVTITAVAMADGQRITDEVPITVDPATAADPPAVTITGPSSRDTGQTGTFRVNNAGGPITSYAWSATGTGSTGSNATFAASWSEADTYRVTVEVTGPGGTDTDTFDVTVATTGVPELQRDRSLFLQENTDLWERRSVLQFTDLGAVSARFVSGVDHGGFRTNGTFAHTRLQDGNYRFEFVFDELNGSGQVVGRTTIFFQVEGQSACQPNEPALIPSPFSITNVTSSKATIRWTTNIEAGIQSLTITGGGQAPFTDAAPTEHKTNFEYIPGEGRYTGPRTLLPNTTYTVTATMISPCERTASVQQEIFTTPDGPAPPTVEVVHQAPTILSCEVRNFNPDTGMWQEHWTWVDNSVGDTGYRFFSGSTEIVGEGFHGQTSVTTNPTNEGMTRIINTFSPPHDDIVTTVSCWSYGGVRPATTTSSTTEPTTTSSDATTTTTESTTSSEPSTPTTEDTTTSSSDTTTTTESTTSTESTTTSEATTSTESTTTSDTSG